MTRTICILGRQPKLGLGELESLYGSDNITSIGTQAALVESDVAFARLGGSTRTAELLDFIPSTQWQDIVDYLIRTLPSYVENLPEGKIKLGLSYIGGGVSAKTLQATALSLKKAIKITGRSIRIIPNSASELNTAQVLHNHLASPTGVEILIIPDRTRTVIARTTAVQDINAYAARDQQRPKRDARVGMLPPKLAQIIINLATGATTPALSFTVLDPFCGTGVVLQEAQLMGYSVYGTDLEPRMIEYSQINLEWLTRPDPFLGKIEVGDATKHQWSHLNTVACETYLGRPLSSIPSPDKLAEIMQDCDTIHRKFLQNLAQQTKPGFRACIAVPAWRVTTHRSGSVSGKAKNFGRTLGAGNHFSSPVLSRSTDSTASSAPRAENGSSTPLRSPATNDGFKHLKTLDSLHDLGYNRMRFVHVRSEDLIYHRPDQVVARELVILERI